jgi:outer membrane receptor protein involved in Fe transport
MHPRKFIRHSAAGLLLCSSGLALRAQTAPATPTPPSASDEVVLLSEFNVTATDDNGYMPAESTSGSRVAIKITDLPYAVNVVTAEFLSDFNIFDLTEEGALPSSVSGLDQGGNFSIRGFGGNVTLRNGFARVGNFDRTSADRIEYIKGPAAAIYGQTAPGGLINIISKQPRFKRAQKISASYGAYETTRVDLESTGAIPLNGNSKKLAYIANASYFHREFEGKELSQLARSFYLAGIYRFTDQTNLMVNFDYSFTRNNNVQLPFQIDPSQPTTSTRRYTGVATEIADLYYSNSSNWNRRIIHTLEAVFEHRINEIFSMRAGASLYNTPRYSYSSGGLSNYNPVTRTLTRTRRPNFSFLEGDGQSAAIDLVASYNWGPTRHKTLLTVDYYKNEGDRPTFNSVSTTFGPGTVSVDAPTNIPYVPFRTDRLGIDYVVDRDSKDYAATVGNFLRHQFWAFDERFIAVAGVRYDDVTLYKKDYRLTYPVGHPRAGQPREAKLDGISNTSTMLGFNYKIVPGVTFYGSRSESFVPGQPNNLDLNVTPVVAVPNQTGLGYETGFKFDAFNNRLSATIAFYEITLENVQVREPDPNNPNISIVTFDGGQKSRGFEIDSNLRMSNKLSLLASYSYTHSRATDRGEDVDVMSRQFLRIPYHQAGATLTYQVTPALRTYVNLRHMGKAFVDATTPALSFKDSNTGLFTTNDGRRLIQSPDYTIFNLGVSYDFKTSSERLKHKINLTAKNLFDKEYFQANRYVGDRFGIYSTYSLSY